MITVKDILEKKRKAFNITSPDMLVIDALTMLNSVDLSYLIVMDGNEYKGIFSERDYSRNVILKGRSSRTTTVKEVMTRDLPIVHLEDTAEYCMNTMITFKTRYLLAYHENQFAGVVTIHDLLRQVIGNREMIFDQSLAEKLLKQNEGEKIF
jgi:CBS domain-containing protein